MKNEGFITIRDLIKWGNRDINSYEKLGIEGYILLAEKLSNKDDKEVVKKIIESHLKNKICLSKDFINDYYEKYVKEKFLLKNENYKKIKFTKSMYRMITLIDKAISNHEAVLLIGDTGTGKNLSVEFIAEKYNRKLITINCHENMDTNDFLGSLRSNTNNTINNNDNSKDHNNNNNEHNLFEWIDGPITTSMKNGNFVLIDEIDLVLDSVLERMNSIFEADSVLVLSEKNINDNVEIIKPYQNYAIISTICLKGNEAKKEFSQIDLIKFFFNEILTKILLFQFF
jgi:midasin